MRLKYKFEIRHTGNCFMAVSLDERFNGIIELNETGKRIFELLENEIEEDELIKIISSEFEDSEEIEIDIKRIIEDLKRNDLLEL